MPQGQRRKHFSMLCKCYFFPGYFEYVLSSKWNYRICYGLWSSNWKIFTFKVHLKRVPFDMSAQGSSGMWIPVTSHRFRFSLQDAIAHEVVKTFLSLFYFHCTTKERRRIVWGRDCSESEVVNTISKFVTSF